MINGYKSIVERLANLGTPERAKASAWYFKTGPGEYGEGDKFIGVTVPQMRRVAKEFGDLNFFDLKKLLDSSIHEHRFVALIMLIDKYRLEPQKVVKFYLKNISRVNNWDLVDTSAPKILGNWLVDKDKKILYQFAVSKNLWKRRVAVLSTFAFIGKGKYQDSLKIAKILLNDKEDLIHKAVGWMLREIGKRDLEAETKFLDKYHKKMPRTMLRYAIEKFSNEKKSRYI